ncbi:hypothetical protein EDB84DRAFT_1582159 [Lactarius hengduanensis]|nr:hypothetical protein EDB84DRAFT_1582159 [Lactarius hengduanensis]
MITGEPSVSTYMLTLVTKCLLHSSPDGSSASVALPCSRALSLRTFILQSLPLLLWGPYHLCGFGDDACGALPLYQSVLMRRTADPCRSPLTVNCRSMTKYVCPNFQMTTLPHWLLPLALLLSPNRRSQAQGSNWPTGAVGKQTSRQLTSAANNSSQKLPNILTRSIGISHLARRPFFTALRGCSSHSWSLICEWSTYPDRFNRDRIESAVVRRYGALSLPFSVPIRDPGEVKATSGRGSRLRLRPALPARFAPAPILRATTNTDIALGPSSPDAVSGVPPEDECANSGIQKISRDLHQADSSALIAFQAL